MTYNNDRRGRLAQAARNGITSTLTYNDADELQGEIYSGGTLGGLIVTNLYDSFLRRTEVSSKNGSTQLAATDYAYDTASRLQTVTAGVNSATYSYLANSPLISQITFKSNTIVRMTTTKTYDFLNRLGQISSVPSASSAVSFSYAYNSANERIRTTLADGSYWTYEYDNLGQVKTGKRYWSDNTPVAGQQFVYGFDDIGNRTQTKVGGDANGANLRTANYVANNRNQYTQRDVPGTVDIIGAASATATNVNVNGQLAYRRGEYYLVPLPINNASAAQWPGVTNRAVQNGTTNSVTGNFFLPQTPEVFSHDADGNLTNDGRWAFTWDGENRLIAMAAPTTAPSGSCKALTFAYDYQGRRISKVVSNWTGSAWSKVGEQRFLYDGWNLIADLDANNALLHSYSWGTDLSGSMQGAGGVGGLVGMTVQSGTNAGSYFVAYDGNGNVAALANAADGTIAARYEYGPFGELIRSSGSAAASNPCRFSTKFTDDETDLASYDYRYYNPSTGRWINRDPIGDEGFFEAYAARRSWSEQLELRSEGLQPGYAIDGNNPIDRFDAFGLLRFDSKCKPSDIERMKKDLKDRCETAKKSDCFRCLKQKGRDALSKMCEEIDKNTGPKVVCEDSSNKDCAQNNWCAWTGALGGIHVCVGKMSDPTISCSMPGCSLLHEGGHSVGGVGDDTKPTGDNRSYAIEKCVGCAVPDGRKLPPGY